MQRQYNRAAVTWLHCMYRVFDVPSAIHAPNPGVPPGLKVLHVFDVFFMLVGMIHGAHIVFCTYGFWLPNDPRGSWSTAVHAPHLQPFGQATKTNTRQSVANRNHDHTQRLGAKAHLKYPAVSLTAAQIDCVADAFAQLTREHHLHIHACAIMPDHVHVVAGRHDMPFKQMAGMFKRAATRQLNHCGLHPLEEFRDRRGRPPSPWAVGDWVVYLNSPAEIHQRIAYTRANPTKSGLPAQSWPFVKPYH